MLSSLLFILLDCGAADDVYRQMQFKEICTKLPSGNVQLNCGELNTTIYRLAN